MSTYYYFTCDKCEERSGFAYSRQAWGFGNADIIHTFQWLMHHTWECGHEHIRIFDEYALGEFDRPETDKGKLLAYYPHSDDWREEVHKAAWDAHIAHTNREGA